ncbi:MAG: MATE family efflux transporter [Leptolyngbyaceae cyanobacterium SL_7_1]|nr:MATE family efflux transporter [Leptolyngbyaceae cyanobacterium SL_7_1]
MVPLAGLVDVAFLGHLSEIRHLAGVALATVLFNYIYWTFGFLRMATTGTTAQAVGRGDRDQVLLIGLRSVCLALGIGLVILLLQYPLQEIGFALLKATSEVKESGRAYYEALIWGAPATLINFVILGWLLGQSRGSQVLLLSVIGNGANTIFNYLFIVLWGLESAGAGWGTALSQYVMLLTGLGLISREVRVADIQRLVPQIYNFAALQATIQLNRDILIRTFALISTFALFTNLSSLLGMTVLAANTLLLQVVTLTAYFIDGIAFATESFAGILRGQNQTTQLIFLLRLAGMLSVGVGLGFALVFIVAPDRLFSFLTNHSSVITQIRQYVGWLLPVLGFGSIAYLLDGYFLGLTEGRILRTSSLISSLVGFAPGAIVAWQMQSNQLLWAALALFMLSRAVTLALQIPRTLRI